MTNPGRNKGSNDAAQQRRGDQQRREEEAARLRELEEGVNALLLLRAGFGEFGLWGNIPGNVPGTLPLQWQQNWRSFPGARPVSFGPVARSATATTTNVAHANTRANIPAGTTSATTSHGRHAVSTARLDTLATVAASRERLPLAQEASRPLSDRTNGASVATPVVEFERARSMAPSPEARPPSSEGPRRSQAPSPEARN